MQTVFTLFSEFGLVLIGSAFLSFATAFYLFSSLYKGRLLKTDGIVVGIEKYMATMRSDSRSVSQLLYRQVVSFTHNGVENYFVDGLGKNTIGRKVGASVRLEYLEGNINSVRVAERNIFRKFAVLLALIGLVLVATSILSGRISLLFVVAKVLFPLVLNYALFHFLSGKIGKAGETKEFWSDNSRLKSKEDLDQLDILWSNAEISNEDRRVHRPFLYILPIVIGLLSWVIYSYSVKFLNSTYVAENFSIQTVLNLNEGEVFLSQVMSQSQLRDPFLMMLVCGFFIVVSIHSFFYCLRKMNR
ncbi:MAG: hypothetical protein ACI8W7_004417 [Gammaproteobacteria bacterium]|jgi:hypothetical protein